MPLYLVALWSGLIAVLEFLYRRHVRSDRLQRLLDETDEHILVTNHSQELNTLRQRLRIAQGRNHHLEYQFNYRVKQYRILQERINKIFGVNEDLKNYLRQGRILIYRNIDELRYN